MGNMKNEIKHSNVLNALNTDPSPDPNKKHNLFTKTLIELKNKYITKNGLKDKLKENKQVTFAILIHEKNKMYKQLQQSDTSSLHRH